MTLCHNLNFFCDSDCISLNGNFFSSNSEVKYHKVNFFPAILSLSHNSDFFLAILSVYLNSDFYSHDSEFISHNFEIKLPVNLIFYPVLDTSIIFGVLWCDSVIETAFSFLSGAQSSRGELCLAV